MNESASMYVHGTTASEQKRLTMLNQLMNQRCLEAIQPRTGERVLDIGSGLGQMTRALARATGQPALGIERSAEQIQESMRQAREEGEQQLIDIRQGSVEALPLQNDELNSFELVHARFILEHVRDPLKVVLQMMRAVKPGGRIVLLDDDHDVLRIWPEIPGFVEIWRAYQRTYELIGCDPIIGRKLVSLLAAAGARPVRNQWIWFGACAGDGTLPMFVENLLGVIATAEEHMVRERMIAAGDVDQLSATARTWAQREDASLWFAIAFAEGVCRKR